VYEAVSCQAHTCAGASMLSTALQRLLCALHGAVVKRALWTLRQGARVQLQRLACK
jgi:hypothetical protein